MTPASQREAHATPRIPLGLSGRFALAGLSAAAVGLAPSGALAFETNTDPDIITDTVASSERAQYWDHTTKYGAGSVAAHQRGVGEPEGLRYGNFRFAPSATTNAIYDDNIFRSNTDRQKDVRIEVLPSVVVTSELPRHVLNFGISGKLVEYLEHDDQNYQNVRANFSGGLHFDHAHTLSVALLSELGHEEKGLTLTPKDAASPIPYFHNRAAVGLTRDVGRLYGTVTASFDRYDYDDVKNDDGDDLDQDYRDNDQITGQLKVGYRFSPGFDVVTKLKAIRQLNEGDEFQSSQSTGYEATAGVRFETSPLLRWELLGGYGIRDYDRSDMETVGSSLVEGRVEWLATERLTFNGSISRALYSDTIDSDLAGGVVETKVDGRIDYDIFHNLVAHAGVGFVDADFQAVDRQDQTYSAHLGLDYYLSKNWLFTLGYDYEVRKSTDDDYDMTRNRIMVGAKLKF